MDMLKGLFTDRAMIENLMKVGTMLAISALIKKQKVLKKDSLYILIGFASYHMIAKRLTPRVGDYRADKVISIAIKVGTMMIVSALLGGKKVNKELILGIGATTAGFSAYELLISKFMPTIANPIIRSIVGDAIAVFTMTSVKNLALGKKVNKSSILSAIPTIVGFVVYDIVSPMIM